MSIQPAVFIMGPTASGKTEISVGVAADFDCEIISVDSAMVYRDMNIGTAKPTLQQRGGIPHHLIDILDPSESYSAALFREQAIELMEGILNRNKIPLLTGGTMLYFDRLLNGIAKLPGADPVIRRDIEREAARAGWSRLHDQLAEIDPDAALRIHPNDPQRIQRALEVYRITGKTISDIHRHGRQTPGLPCRAIKIVVEPRDRSVLHSRIRKRLFDMIRDGFIEEVQSLYDRGDLHSGLPAIRAVGYKQIWGYLDGLYDKDSMVEKATVASRRLAKRQLTWLRKEREAHRFFVEDRMLTYNIKSRLAELLDKDYNR